MKQFNRDFWNGRRVFVTGHMGFKGTWLCSLLESLGAESVGFGYDDREHLLYNEQNLTRHTHRVGNINDFAALKAAAAHSGAEVMFHLAAQPIVLTSYADPIGTFETNVTGTVRVLEAARSVPSLKAIIIVTSDKVYRNNEWVWGYREQDVLGGNDPYSASKAAAEIATQAMVKSFFAKIGAPRVATVRAGNVIGGGDWADFRLLPDAAKAISAGKPLVVRNPKSTRPWQHVLDPLTGYLMLAERLASGIVDGGAWNFGPAQEDMATVGEVADLFVAAWGNDARWITAPEQHDEKHEARQLAVDSAKARRELGWLPRWKATEAVQRTAAWYRDYAAGEKAAVLIERDITDYFTR
ncbi:CDP-glucose 4,6-dehydratase [Nitrobacteraceae bacterium AZCC 1564]